MVLIPLVTSFWPNQKCMFISAYLVKSKYPKMHQQEILSIDHNVLEFFWVSLNTEFLTDLYKKFQVVSMYDTNVEYTIWCFCCSLLLSYADNRHTDTQICIHTDQTLKMLFSDTGDLKTCKSVKISISKIRPKNNTFSTYR